MKKKKKKEIYGVGRRKTAVARVFVRKGISENLINRRISISDYFSNQPLLLKEIFFPLKLLGKENEYRLIIRVNGGGFSSQAQAIKLATARVLLKIYPEYKKLLKSFSLLTVDSRQVERKKIGLKKARRAPQFSKR